MADFSTHLFSATAVCTFSATLFTKVLGLPMTYGLLLVAAGVTGGVLPDIDLERSKPSRLLFGCLGIATALSWLFSNVAAYSVVELVCVASALLIGVRYPLAALFHRYTVHRGALHSLAAAAMAGMLTTVAGSAGLGLSALGAWLLGTFMAAGYIVHLTLDELYSVDFAGARLKRSFGSALKPIDLQHLWASAAIFLITGAAWTLAPPVRPLMDALRIVGTQWRGVMLP